MVGLLRSQNHTNSAITSGQICPKRPFSQNFLGAFGDANNFEL